MKRTSNLIVIIGIFCVVGIMLLFWLSLRAQGPGDQGGYTLYTELKNARGLEKGAEVVRAGVPIGTVQDLKLVKEKNRVRITMKVFETAEVRQDAVCSIQLKSLLGAHHMHITHGDLSSPPADDGDVLKSEEAVDLNEVLKVVAELGADAGSLIDKIGENQSSFFEEMTAAGEKINAILDENRGNVKTITDTLAQQAPKVESFFDTLQKAETAIRDQKGTVGKLIFSSELHDNANQVAGDLKAITSEVRKGEGTLGRVIYDKKMGEQAASIFTNVDEAAQAANRILTENEADITEMFKALSENLPKLGETLDSFQETGENFAQISEKINKGKGTLARLINEDVLYTDIRAMVTQIKKTFEEGEEQSVLRTFLGVFFGSMM